MQTTTASKGKVVQLTKEVADKIKVLRLKDVGLENGGFQRKLDTARVISITNVAKKDKALVVPPITIAQVGDELICVDGQHRLEAWKRQSFNLLAHIVPMTLEEATNNFVVMNATARRVSLVHRLKVDPTEAGKKLRTLALKYECEPSHLHSVIAGIMRGRVRASFAPSQMNSNDWQFIESFMSEWTKDRRWKSTSQCYNKIGTLRIVSTMSMKTKKPFEFIKMVKNMGFQAGSALHSVYGSAGWNQRAMRDVIANWLVAKAELN